MAKQDSVNAGSWWQKLAPVIAIVAVVLTLLVLAWVGTPDDAEHGYRPPLALTVELEENTRPLIILADDIRYRMNTHHTYRITDEPEDAHFRVLVRVRTVSAGIRAEAEISSARSSGYTQVVEGPENASLMLSGKLFSLINQEITRQTNQ
ncbi:hypothetical protein FM042_11290 [Aliidiomarina halalkaliphila]|uniref:Uncharacterized protein n=1 Tax=Aliidiomarina halalkaliphila TaxID=2593535 RepID=A0A552X002_9GAMM|nr:hypothetical protein [Aliidiomarina halalkaliphila]TRW47913.1 hypothetical protein FM042_11290 [Aliidiomarina halalkaliphila]